MTISLSKGSNSSELAARSLESPKTRPPRWTKVDGVETLDAKPDLDPSLDTKDSTLITSGKTNARYRNMMISAVFEVVCKMTGQVQSSKLLCKEPNLSVQDIYLI